MRLPAGKAEYHIGEEVPLDLVFQGIDRDIHRRGQGLDASGTSAEDANQCLEVTAILLVEPLGIDLLHVERLTRDRDTDVPVGAGDVRRHGENRDVRPARARTHR